jgi:hypothetical protein
MSKEASQEQIECWNCGKMYEKNEVNTDWIPSAFEGEMVLAYCCPYCDHKAYGVEVELNRGKRQK